MLFDGKVSPLSQQLHEPLLEEKREGSFQKKAVRRGRG
jgi:hypothetical protein